MKKCLHIIAAGAVLSLFLCGCSSAKISGFSIDENNIVENYCEYRVISIEASSQIKPPVPKDYYNYYDTKDDSRKYLAVEFDVKNLSGKTIPADQFMNAQYFIGDSKYTVASIVETADCSQLIESKDTQLQPDGEKKIMFISKIPAYCLENEITMELDIAGKRYKTSFNLDEINSSRVYESQGSIVKGEDGIEIQCGDVKFIDLLKPAEESLGDYKSFKPKDERHIFLMADAVVKNTGSEAVKADEAMNIRAVYDKKYDSTKLYETDDGKNLDYVSDLNIEPQSEQKVIYIMEVPKDCMEEEGYIEINLKDSKHFIKVQK